jgi:hypothetical protein
MKRIKEVFCFVLILSICISCNKKNDNMYFNGEIRNFEVLGSTKKVTLETISLDGANFGWLAVFDSLMIFRNPKLVNRFFSIFNVDNGEELGTFCNKGGGPDELSDCHKIFNFFKEGDDLKTLLLENYEEKMFIWNITQSVKQGTTVIDTIISYASEKDNKSAPYGSFFFQKDNTLLAKVQSVPLGNGDATLPFYQQRTIDTNKLLKNYSIYKQSVKDRDSPTTAQTFSSSNDACKLDGTKVVQAMLYLPQLNILDVETGQVVGFRMKGAPDFSIFEDEKDVYNIYYIGVQADDDYIYALYWGKESWGRFDVPYVNTIHVFDWNGNFVQAIEVDRGLDAIWIDPTRNRLYVTSPKVDDVFYLDLDGILGEVVQ